MDRSSPVGSRRVSLHSRCCPTIASLAQCILSGSSSGQSNRLTLNILYTHYPIELVVFKVCMYYYSNAMGIKGAQNHKDYFTVAYGTTYGSGWPNYCTTTVSRIALVKVAGHAAAFKSCLAIVLLL